MRRSIFSLALIAVCSAPFICAGAVQPLVLQSVDEARMQRLPGNTHPLARAEFDQGIAPADLPLERMLLVLKRSPEQETALQALLLQQQDESSPQYHKWLTPDQFGQQFGPVDQDIQAVTGWLESHGFQVARVSKGRNIVEFSGTAGQVLEAFHTEIHKYVVNGEEHWANSTDPMIPAALAPVTAGIATLHNFQKKSQIISANRSFEANLDPVSKHVEFTSSTDSHALAPGDYAVIYNINPVYNSGIDGTGASVAVVARSNINISDISGANSFRSTFGLPNNPPQIIVNGPDPGDLGGGEEAEAVLDTSWSGATAIRATIKLVISKTTSTTDGVDLSEEYIIDNNLSDVMTESFGDCEANYTRGEADFYSSLATQAAAQGITYTVAAGDSGAEGCDDPTETSATGPLSVNILASTPYTIAVGGTEFNENGNDAAYWSSTNRPGLASALSYIPEDVWNESCTVAQCGSANAGLWAGGGGASTLFSKPSWQSGVTGIPDDGARDVPDVAMTAAGHDAYLLCLDGSCTPNSRNRISFQGYSGTSAATPSFAGIMALVVQKTGSRQGQADQVLYPLAASENLSECDASNAAGLPAASCIFNDVRVGNNAVPGESGYGTSASKYQAGIGYDLATGLGSVNVANLVNNWTHSHTSSPQFEILVDQPRPTDSTLIGSSVFSGWAIYSKAAIVSVGISIDGVPFGNASYGLSRPDVCAVYPGPGCPEVGWSIPVDTTQLSDGAHTLDVTATSGAGTHFTISTPFTVANWTIGDPMRVDIDTPNSQSGAFSGLATFGGWVIDDDAAIGSVSISVDGVPYGSAGYGGSRPDVCTIFPGRAGCPNVGWNFALDTTQFADGIHTLAVTGTSVANQSSTVTASFTVSNSAGNPITMSIDRPNSQSASFSGPAAFGGWAISSDGAITSVAVSIDGVFQGNAVYGGNGGNRPDVCAVFPGRAGCPYVGWNFVLDTAKVSNGNHILEITATSTSGRRATISAAFAVANVTTGIPMKIFVDNPGPENFALEGLANFSGWALDDAAAMTNVTISIDGAPRGTATYGIYRPDVCTAYPGRPGCPYVGWTFPIDTNLIPDGVHTLEVTGTSAAGDQLTVPTPFTVGNWTTANPMRISIDTPNTQSASLSGPTAIGGWALDDIAAITSVAVSVDGVSFGNAAYGGNRPDVCSAFPDRPGCPNVGWNFLLDTTLLPDGMHTLEITATSAGGQHTTVTQTFTVANVAASAIDISIDTPSSNETLSGIAAIGGWAIDLNSGTGIAGVQILIDGVSVTTAGYGGDRPDVCAAFGDVTGCPNVGWNAVVDTTLLADGVHTMEAQASATDGQQLTVSTLFNVSN